MTAPIWSLESRARQDQSLADSEWEQYKAVHKQLMDALAGEIQGYANQTGLTPPNAVQQAQTDPGSMQPAQQPLGPGQVDRGREDLVQRAHFWNVPNPEGLSNDQLQQAIASARAGDHRAPEPTLGTFSQAVGASAVEAGGVMAKLLGNLSGQVGQSLEMLPFAGKFLSDMLNTERARTWLYGVASRADEDVQHILAQQPAQNVAATQFLLGAGKMAGYALPAIGAWEGLGALGASLPSTPWLARFATPLARSAVKGALSSLVLQDPDESAGQQAMNVGLGAILGGTNMWGRVGAAAGLGAIGAGIGGEIGQTPEERRQHAIEWGLGGAVLPFIAPAMGKAFVKVAAGFRNAFDDAIPVDQSQRPPAPGEEVVTPEQISGNPPPPPAGVGPGGGFPALPPGSPIDEAIRSEPTMQIGPSGVPEPVQAEPTQPVAIGQPQVAGLLPAQTVPETFDPRVGTRTSFAVVRDDISILQQRLDFPDLFPPDQVAEARSNLPLLQREYDRLVFEAQRNAPLGAKGLASVTEGPSHLVGSKVADAQGRPLRVYHGTAADFGEFDMSKANPEALFGPGLYHTEDVGVAGGTVIPLETRTIAAQPGYAQLSAIGQPGITPNVRPAWLDIKNPFDADKAWSEVEATSLIDKLETSYPEYDWESAREALTSHPDFDAYGDVPMTAENGESLYNTISSVPAKAQPQGPHPDWSYIDTSSPLTFGKANTNKALEALGYDGITHIGGGIVGDHPHRVWIAFSPSQVHAPWQAAPLDRAGALDAAAAMSKQAVVMESAALFDAAAKPGVGNTDAVTAMKVTNPGGTSVLRDVGDALQVMQDHPDVNFVQRDDKIDALIGEFTPEMVQDYKEFGMYSGQEVVTARGIEGRILHITGKGFAVVERASGGPPLRVKVENLLPGRFGDPQRSAPDLWESFKADLLRYSNEEAGAAGMAPVDSIWDIRAQESMQQHLQDYLSRRGINDPADRQAIDAYINQRFVQEAKDLDPEARDLQARLGDSATAAENEREAGPEPLPVSTEERAQSKGFIWLSDPGTGGGMLKDTLNPEGGLEIPMQTEDAANDFIGEINRTAPDLTPAADAPAEAMEDAPADGNLEPRWGVEEESDALADHLAGFGAGEPPTTPPGMGPAMGPDDWARIPGNKETLGAQFQRLRRDSPEKLDELRRMFKSNVFRYTRYLMQKVEDQLTQAGVDMGRAWMHYEALETARTKSDYEARPWLDEYGSIMREFKSKILRSGDVTKIHEIEDPNARYASWYRLKDKYGYTDGEIRRFIAADDKLADFNHRWFQYLVDDPSYGLTSEREIFRYMSHVRARQAAGATGDVYDSTGFLSPNTEYFAEFAREGNLQFRVMDARELGNYMIRAGMFKKWQAGPWQDLVSAWQDPRVPSEFQDLMLGHAHLMKFGYNGQGDLLVGAVRWLVTNVLRVPINSREAANILNVPVSGMYRALLGGRTSIFFRDAIQPLLALSKVRTDVMAGVYRDVLGGSGENSFAAMKQRGLEGGWITPDAPAMEAAGVFEAPVGLRQDELLHLSPAQAARRERVAEIGDIFRDAHRLRQIDRATNTLHLYGKEQGINRMIVGEGAFRQAQTALAEFRASQLTAILNRDPGMAMDYQEFADKSMFSSFSRPIQRRLQELVEADQDKEAAQLFARQVADLTQFKYGRREQPAIVRGQFGRMMYTFGNFTGQFAEAVGSMLTSGSANPVARARQVARAAMVIGGVSYALRELEQRTGWGFSKWAWPASFKFIGSPVAQTAANLYQAAGGAITASQGYTPSQSQAGAIQDLTTGNPILGAAADVFPYTGYLRTATELSRASQSAVPVEQAARFLVTGDRGTRGLLLPQNFFQDQADSLRAAILRAGSARAAGHPGNGAIP